MSMKWKAYFEFK